MEAKALLLGIGARSVSSSFVEVATEIQREFNGAITIPALERVLARAMEGFNEISGIPY